MSYVRFGSDGSDVYVFACIYGWLECCGCSLGDDWAFYSTDDMIAHLKKHEATGDHVPPRVYADLETDRQENDQWIEEHHAGKVTS